MSLSLLTEQDRDRILSWRNAVQVRRAMFNSREISLAEHRAWFDTIQNDVSARWYLYQDNNGPSGVVYFKNLDSPHNIATWGFYAKPGSPKGTGQRLMHEALEECFLRIQLRKLNAEVLVSNSPSIYLHEKLGFVREGIHRARHRVEKEYLDVHCFGLFRSEWEDRYAKPNT